MSCWDGLVGLCVVSDYFGVMMFLGVSDMVMVGILVLFDKGIELLVGSLRGCWFNIVVILNSFNCVVLWIGELW